MKRLLILSGKGGTGKTTSLRGVLALFDALGLETALAAPTGRAAGSSGFSGNFRISGRGEGCD